MTVGPFGSNFPYGESPIYKDEGGDTIRLVERQNICLRFATEPSEGYGWSIYNGDDWVRPMLNWGRITGIDNRDIIRNYVFDATDLYIYEEGSFDRRVYIKPPAMDKEGVEDTEVTWEKWLREETADMTKEDQYIEYMQGHLYVRPDNPDNRGVTGYSASGLRSALEINIDAYVDGEKITPKAYTKDIPENGEIVFPGVHIESRRVQIVYKGTAGEMLIAGLKNIFDVKGRAGSRTERTMKERTIQETLLEDKSLHLSRGSNPLMNRVTGVPISGTATQYTGPDGKAFSAFSVASDLNLGLSGITGYTIIAWVRTFNAGAMQNVTLTEYSNDATSGYSLAYATGAGVLPDISLKTGYRWFDVRVYSEVLSGMTTDILPHIYNLVIQNGGKGIVPNG